MTHLYGATLYLNALSLIWPHPRSHAMRGNVSLDRYTFPRQA